MRQVSVDIGGTFTDCFLVYDDTYIEAKSLTTHHNLASGFMDALAKASAQADLDVQTVLSTVDAVRYATTLGTNALIERSGPAVGILTTAGFESTVPLMRARGYGDGLTEAQQSDLPAADRPVSLVPVTRIAGVQERVDYGGTAVLSIDEDDVRRQVRKLVDEGAQAFVVALVNAVINPAHEKEVERIILDEYPTHMLGAIPIVLSHRVTGRKGEYARTMSAVIDAYLHSQMYHGLASLEIELRRNGYTKPMLLVHNTSGMAQLNSTSSLQTIHSGPVAGLEATNYLSKTYHQPNIIATDMGGTSFDIGLVTSDGVKFYDFNPVIDRWLVSTPMTYLHTLGAGGGSIARYDRLWEAIEVGPESAGSDPGPACYGRGGRFPTTTDANLVLGYLDADNYAGGTIKLSLRRAQRAIEEHICKPTGLSLIEAAKAIKRKVDSNMANAIFKEVAVKGYNPKNFVALSYGGGGPLHACGYANTLGIQNVLIPPFSSVFSALGAGNMNQLHIHEYSLYLMVYDATTRRMLDDFQVFNDTVTELAAKGRDDLLRQGADPANIRSRVELDMRYGNQLAQIGVVSPFERLTSHRDVIELLDLFSSIYAKRYGEGSQAPEAGVRINVIRVVSYVERDKFDLQPTQAEPRPASNPARWRECHYPGIDGAVKTAVYDFADLEEGHVIEGPALIETPSTTYLAEPGWQLTIGRTGSAVLVRTI
ncbi:N-methylhydantoinase A/acetone carboxylase, beta subunit [Frankia casuarinae]|uniref:5-oxoprolinase (ATP-hydrolyzing) n=1 Tax=Frankia casuarinae (strain DSM 45818 / CECT 9043 / HFP020203 / CcI3) TaxID=106370 RepID=Q2JAT5_FRACC|nr:MULTISPECIES: hydantoinase/oxoprolinase family protein [Frankia]ABD11607.1 5-oxoprolinase (ATP-hydrolyzing) [Frankia casuarinae]ETA00110.1 N-methylhydantoinase A/acetone carboxylase, beta subunit [Frankia sp. CcI6]EYT90297.1 N-methylhydantoinase A/acetone carboxylase, beta subunit [Frankia casuarinae]KDA41123.1 N-methylhydantoinase A/acetone carboxylase, beta subunit [Frankia sp. BMG5.23]OHV49908.1 hydantoinase [Frankia sp. CgIS1]